MVHIYSRLGVGGNLFLSNQYCMKALALSNYASATSVSRSLFFIAFHSFLFSFVAHLLVSHLDPPVFVTMIGSCSKLL